MKTGPTTKQCIEGARKCVAAGLKAAERGDAKSAVQMDYLSDWWIDHLIMDEAEKRTMLDRIAREVGAL